MPERLSQIHGTEFQSPEVIDKYNNGEKASWIVRSQIDACPGFGRQYSLTGYVVDLKSNSSPKDVWVSNYYENVQGPKGKTAMDLLEK